MIVQCENCNTKFNLDDSKSSPEGTWVRCGNCQHVFQVAPEKPPEEIPPQEPAESRIDLDLGTTRDEDLDDEALMEDLGLTDDLEPEEPEPKAAGGMGSIFKFVFWFLGILLVLVLIAVGGLVVMDRTGMDHLIPAYVRTLPVISSLLSKPAPAPPSVRPAPIRQPSPTRPAQPTQPAQPAQPVRPEPQKPGGQPEAIKMALKDVRGYFRANQKEGRMFIIQGLVENMHQDVRTMTLVRGRLHDKNRKVLRQEMVYAGPVFTPEELRNLPLKEIKGRLSKPEGPDGDKYVVPPKGTIPFMIVFASLPNDVSEFTAEVIASKPLSAVR